MRHQLKTTSKQYQAIVTGKKSFDVRKNDRAFVVGDTLLLNEIKGVEGYYTGNSCYVMVKYILKDKDHPGLRIDYVVMGIDFISIIKPVDLR